MKLLEYNGTQYGPLKLGFIQCPHCQHEKKLVSEYSDSHETKTDCPNCGKVFAIYVECERRYFSRSAVV